MCVSHLVVSNSLRLHGLSPARLLSWDSPGKNTGVGCHSLLQGIFLTQGLNPRLLDCRQILYHLSHQGSLDLWKFSVPCPPFKVVLLLPTFLPIPSNFEYSTWNTALSFHLLSSGVFFSRLMPRVLLQESPSALHKHLRRELNLR